MKKPNLDENLIKYGCKKSNVDTKWNMDEKTTCGWKIKYGWGKGKRVDEKLEVNEKTPNLDEEIQWGWRNPNVDEAEEEDEEGRRRVRRRRRRRCCRWS